MPRIQIINFTLHSWVPKGALEEKRNLKLASNDLPDAFHTARVPDLDILKYGKQGIFIPLNDLIDEYAPNFKELLDEYPEIRASLTFPDGNIYAFPQVIHPEYSARLSSPLWINQEWLDTLGMDIPKTTDEYYEYLKAVKEEDPGDNDGIPYGSASFDPILFSISGSFGIANKGTGNPNIDLDPDDSEKVRFYPTTEGYKEMLEYVHKLYSEGLIEKNIFTIESQTITAQGSDKRYGSVSSATMSQSFGDESRCSIYKYASTHRPTWRPNVYLHNWWGKHYRCIPDYKSK